MKIRALAILGAAVTGSSLAGEKAMIPAAPVTEEVTKSWCDAFDTIGGPLYKNPDNRFIQEIDVFGRVQWQYAYVDGDDVNGDDFDRTFTEWRRTRIGTKVKFLDYFTLKASINLIADFRPLGGSTDFGYQTFDDLLLTADIGKMFGTAGFDSLTLTYGRHRITVSEEVHESSKNIKTIERSAIANKVYGPIRLSGTTLAAEKGDWSYTLGLFGEFDLETVGWYDNGFAYYLSLGYEPTDSAEYIFDALLADYDDPGIVGEIFGYDYALSLSGRYDLGKWEFMWNVIYGDNSGSGDRSGNFYGLVLMPSYWLIDEKLELVGRYQYQGAEEDEGIRLNSRYVRRADRIGDPDSPDVNGGRGDEHHSFYAGLNWYLCGHNLKLMTGVEYDTLDTPDGDVDAWTYFFGGRTYF